MPRSNCNFDRQEVREKLKVNPTDKLHIALDNFDMSFYPSELKQVKKLWNSGTAIQDIATAIDREIEEVFVLLLDMAHRGGIKRREVGLGG